MRKHRHPEYLRVGSLFLPIGVAVMWLGIQVSTNTEIYTINYTVTGFGALFFILGIGSSIYGLAEFLGVEQ